MCAEGYVGDGCMRCNEALYRHPPSWWCHTPPLAEVEVRFFLLFNLLIPFGKIGEP